MVENEKIPIKENSDIKGIEELLEKKLDGVGEIHDKWSDEQVDHVIPNIDKVMCSTNNSIVPEDRRSDLVNE